MNNITLAGIIDGDIEYSHESHGEEFYAFNFSSTRRSGFVDVLRCIVSKFMLRMIDKGNRFQIVGEVRTRNYENISGKRCTEVYVFVNEVLDYPGEDVNHVEIDGYICKVPIYRETPLKRKICEMIVASNRPTNKSDYIPCIAWGRGALFASSLTVGTAIKITGRFQSRQYTKLLEDGTTEVRSAYEVSTISIREVSQEKECEE